MIAKAPLALPSLVETVTGAVLREVAGHPDKPCLVFAGRGEAVSYGQLHAASLRMAALLRQYGVGPGDVVMLFLPTGLDGYAGFLGAMLIGAIPAFMPLPSARQAPSQYWRDHAALLERTAPGAILTNHSTAAAMERSGLLEALTVTLVRVEEVGAPLPACAVVRPRQHDIALLQHSSGTTGLKKGVMLSHGAIARQVVAYSQALSVNDADVVATWLPVYHDMGLISSTIMPLMLGLTVVVLDPFAWSAKPAALLEAISLHRATLVWQPNFAFEHLVRTVDPAAATLDLSCMRAFVNCSETCRPETAARFARHFKSCGVRPDQLQASYAMAETVFAVSQTVPGVSPPTLTVSAALLSEAGRVRSPAAGELPLTLLSNGPPIPGMSVRIVKPDGTPCGDHEVGEIVVSGASLFDGYFRLPEQTAERLSGRELRTRDMGFIANGDVYVLGRVDDMVVVHGRNFYAGDVEAVVNRVAGIRPGRAVALGVANPAVGSTDMVVVAEAHGEPSAMPALSRAVKREVLQSMGLTLQEARIVPPGWLSKTTSGKISRQHNLVRYLAERRNDNDRESVCNAAVCRDME